MSIPIQPITRRKISIPVPIGGLINALNNIQLKIDEASGAATALEMRLRIIAELVPEVQSKLRKQTKDPYHEAKLYYLIPAIVEIFQKELTLSERQQIESCRPPRNKLTHASFVEFMLATNGEAPGRLFDPLIRKGKPLKKENLLEGALSLERSGALENFTKKARKAVNIVESKILRALE